MVLDIEFSSVTLKTRRKSQRNILALLGVLPMVILAMVQLAYHWNTNGTIGRANGTIGISIGTNGITNGTIGRSNRKAMNRNWSNQKANPALNTKAGNK